MWVRYFNRTAAGLVALLLLGGLWMLADRYLESAATDALPVLHPESCDLNQGPCSLEHPAGGQVHLAITPRPIPMLQELQLTLTLDAPVRTALGDPEALELELVGVEMYMGRQRPLLERIKESPSGEDASEKSQYRGTARLPICITESMTWAATAMPADRPDASFVQFRFVTTREP